MTINAIQPQTHSWGVSCSLNSMPHTTTNCTHRKSAPKVAEDYPWAEDAFKVNQQHVPCGQKTYHGSR